MHQKICDCLGIFLRTNRPCIFDLKKKPVKEWIFDEKQKNENRDLVEENF